MLIIQRSQIAGFSCFDPLAGCLERPYIPSCAERGAGVGRSSTGRSYETVRKGRSGKSTGVVDETATSSANFFWSAPDRQHFPPRRGSRLIYDRRDAPAASSEHRPGSHRAPLGDRPRGVHLLRPARRRRERRDGDRARARFVRCDLVLRTTPRRGRARPAPPATVERSATPLGGWCNSARARTTASASAPCRSRPRAARARRRPPCRGSRGALREGAPPVAAESGRRLSSDLCIGRPTPLA
jgi:hypothetical protein